MIKDIHFSFIGFHGSDGYCHLRIAQKSPSSKMVIVCSQYKNYYGTSPTNALEIIAKKLFYDIVNGVIKGISLPVLPTYESWHDDATWLDKALVGVAPQKYKSRFKNTYLDIPKIFKEIVWIERYPVGTSYYDDKELCSLVSMGEREDPHWHGRPSEKYLIDHTGFQLFELLARPEVIDLKIVKEHMSQLEVARNELTGGSDRQVRWSQDLLKILPRRIRDRKFAAGKEESDAFYEVQIQALILEILATSFPAQDLFDCEFKVSKRLGIHKSGSEKKCDIVVFAPESNDPCILIEIKRANRLANGQLKQIKQDLAKLLIYSKVIKSDSYFLLCGNSEEINFELDELEHLLSKSNFFDGQGNLEQCCAVNEADFGDEFENYMRRFGINNLHSRLIGIGDEEDLYLWQISHTGDNLISNKPYSFRLMDPIKT